MRFTALCLILAVGACGGEPEPSPRPTIPNPDMSATPDLPVGTPDTTPDTPAPCPDADGDGVCDAEDVCALGDDGADADSDGVPDACDVCEGQDDTADADNDGAPDGCDVCSGFPDGEDADSDGVPDGCDACGLGDDAVDGDGDGVADACDVCPGINDSDRGVRNTDFSTMTDWEPMSAIQDERAVLADDTPLTQSVCTPQQESMPQQMTFSLDTTCNLSIRCRQTLEVTVDDVLHTRISLRGRAQEVSLCLGEAYYGGAQLAFTGSVSRDSLLIDNVSVSAAPALCPSVGTVGNGDFSQDLALWTTSNDGVTLESDPDGGKYAHLVSQTACGSAFLRGKVSVPLGMANPALRWRWRGQISGNSAFTVSASGEQFSAARGGSDFRTGILCLPEDVKGAVVDVVARAGAPGSVTCADTVTRDIYVDDFEVVSAPAACP